jgi:hypothetical protein
LLATQVAPTVTPSGVRQPWLLRPHLSQFVTSLSRGYANRLNRVIGGRGTSTLLDSQPCRLHRHPSRRFALACYDSLLCPGRPASVPLRHTIARSVPATQNSRKWLDGVSDALAYALRRLGTCRPQATTAIRPRRRLPMRWSPPPSNSASRCAMMKVLTVIVSAHESTPINSRNN